MERTKKPVLSRKHCPHGHTFGVEFEKYKECDDCKLWNECVEKSDEYFDACKKIEKVHRTEIFESFKEAMTYLKENGDLFTLNQLTFLMSIEWYWIMQRLTPKQVDIYIKTISLVKLHEEALKKKYRCNNE